MNRKELDQLIKKFVSEPSPDTETLLKDVFIKSILKIIRTISQIKDVGLNFNEHKFRSLCKIKEFCENMTDFEIDSIDTGSNVIILKIIPAPSGSLLLIDKNYLCDDYLNRELERLIQSVKYFYQREIIKVKKQLDDCSDKFMKANALKVKL